MIFKFQLFGSLYTLFLLGCFVQVGLPSCSNSCFPSYWVIIVLHLNIISCITRWSIMADCRRCTQRDRNQWL